MLSEKAFLKKAIETLNEGIALNGLNWYTEPLVDTNTNFSGDSAKDGAPLRASLLSPGATAMRCLGCLNCLLDIEFAGSRNASNNSAVDGRDDIQPLPANWMDARLVTQKLPLSISRAIPDFFTSLEQKRGQ